jgi:2-polyprenyl-3-methyl-5-hydroxy-6-metoxy-1,4-benzoquinol methylase
VTLFQGSYHRRHKEPEVMDQPDLDPAQHAQALRGLERINFLSGSAGILWPGIQQIAIDIKDRPLRLLDVATGAGDIPIRLWHRSRKAGLELEVAGCDRSLVALDHARRQARESGAQVNFFEHDILGGPLPETYDIVTCSLFLHHLTEAEAVTTLRTMAQAAKHLLLVNDLRRSRLGWWLAWLGTRVLSRSPVVHFDGPVSVAGAFNRAEMKELADQAGLRGAVVSRRWPCRMLLSYRPRL